MTQMTLIAEARQRIALSLPAGFAIREPEPADAQRLGRLYFDSRVPGAAHASAADAIHEIRLSFQGEFGALWPQASGLVEHEGGPVAALLAVHRAPWHDTPDCPFITDLFTDRGFRRQGLARTLLTRCLTRASMIDRPRVALRVDSRNEAAIHLYESLGFRPYGCQ
jgi:ribosomal protein S18 acetylase RimI-like enzyme